MPTRSLLFTVALVGSIGCSRWVPGALPRTSAASLDATEAAPARLGLAITEEPPLPGEAREGWEGLERGGAATAEHHGHGGHRGHGGHAGSGHAP